MKNRHTNCEFQFRLKKVLIFALFLIFFSTLNSPSFADPGGWISSGGEVFKTDKNPWFLKNTVNVQYCVEYSKEEMTPRLEETLAIIEASFQYWKKELNGQSLVGQSTSTHFSLQSVQLAQQNFQRLSQCTETADLVFKFGYKTLNSDEIKRLKDPQKFVGVTLRKEYDEISMRGRGIIYITGDLGEFAYKKTSSEVIDKAWSFPRLLQYAIIHELGHVFGLTHSGNGLMSEVFLDQLLIRKVAALYVREPLISYIKAIDVATICEQSGIPRGSQSLVYGYFNLEFGKDCLKIERNPGTMEYSVLTRKINDVEWKNFGKLVIDKTELTDFSLKPAVIVQLPDNQKVFEKGINNFLLGPVFQNFKVDGHFNFNGSLKPYPVQIDLSPDNLVIYGFYQNKLRQVFSFGSSFLFNLYNPF